MQRFVLPYFWPVIIGVILAALLLLAFPERLPNPFAEEPPPLSVSGTAFTPLTKPDTQRTAP